MTMDAVKRSDKLWRHVVGSDARRPAALRGEGRAVRHRRRQDARREVHRALGSDSKDSSERRVLDANRRRTAARCAPSSGAAPTSSIRSTTAAGSFYVRINDTARNFRLVARRCAQSPTWRRRTSWSRRATDVMIEDVDVFAEHLVVTERVAGSCCSSSWSTWCAAASTRSASTRPPTAVGLGANAEFETTTPALRLHLARRAGVDLGLRHGDARARAEEAPAGARRLRRGALRERAPDGQGRRRHRGADLARLPQGPARPGEAQPLLLYGYGSYGMPIDPWFSSARVSLLDRGVVFAIAHVRGGGDLGRTWYEAGKMAQKMTSFTDFVACAETLIERGWTTPERAGDRRRQRRRPADGGGGQSAAGAVPRRAWPRCRSSTSSAPCSTKACR